MHLELPLATCYAAPACAMSHVNVACAVRASSAAYHVVSRYRQELIWSRDGDTELISCRHTYPLPLPLLTYPLALGYCDYEVIWTEL